MKRLLIIVTILILTWFGYTAVTNGFSSDIFNVNIESYETIKSESESMTKELAKYNKKNNETYKDSEKALNTAIKKYKSTKAEYEDLVEESSYSTYQDSNIDEGNYVIGSEDQLIYSSKVAYEIEFLLTTIGVYADKEGVDITMDVLKSSNYDITSNSIGYILCDLNFTVKGEYMNITKFIYDLEDDDELAFEIRNFSMVAEKASFKVYGVPINSETLIDSNMNNTILNNSVVVEESDSVSDNISSSSGNEVSEKNTTDDTDDTKITNSVDSDSDNINSVNTNSVNSNLINSNSVNQNTNNNVINSITNSTDADVSTPNKTVNPNLKKSR